MHCNIKGIKSKVFFFFIAISAQTYNINAANVFESESVQIENRSPIIQLFSLSRPDYTLHKKTNTTLLKARVEVINYLSKTKKGDEFFFIDGETLIASTAVQHQISKNLIGHVNIPWIIHSKGTTDPLIYDFHNLFQLPQNGRTQENNNQLSWVLNKHGHRTLSLNDSKSSLGDIQIKLSWTPFLDTSTQLTSQLKLPTGRFDDQSGSEKIDFGVSVAKNNPNWLKSRHWLSDFPLSVWYGAGLNYVNPISEFTEFNSNPIVATIRAGLAWSVYSNWYLKTQVDSNTPLFNSNIRELGWVPLQVSLASEHKISKNVTIDLILIEDLRPRASPDVIFSSGISIQF